MIIATALALITFVSCSSSATNAPTTSTVTNSNTTTSGINFTYFYRGFISADANGKSFVNKEVKIPDSMISVIITEDDWQSYMSKYCPGIPYFISVDFSKESLISYIYSSAKPFWNSSIDINSISVKNNKADIEGGMNSSTAVFAMNNDGGVNNFGLVIVKINKNDLPSGIDGVYKK
jgi:hypothetical protein